MNNQSYGCAGPHPFVPEETTHDISPADLRAAAEVMLLEAWLALPSADNA